MIQQLRLGQLNLNQKNIKDPIKLLFDLIDKKNNKKILKKGEKLKFILANKLKEKNLEKIISFNR